MISLSLFLYHVSNFILADDNTMEYQHANVDTNAGVARNANDEHNKGNYFNRHDEDLTKQQPHLDDTVMKERPKKKKKRGPYQKIEPQTIIAATTNVMRRGYDVEQASIAAQIKPATLRSAIRRYRKKGSMLPEKRGRKPKGEFTKELKEFVLDYVDDREQVVTVLEIREAILNNPFLVDMAPTKTSLQLWLRKNAHLTFKMSDRSFPPSPPASDEASIMSAYEDIRGLPALHVYDNCVFMGEAAYV